MKPISINHCGNLIFLIAIVSPLSIVKAADEGVQGISLGPGLRLETAVEGRIEHTDNKYWTEINEVDALGTILLPEMTLDYRQSAGEYTLHFESEVAEFDTSSRDDYIDFLVGFDGVYRPMTRHGFGLDINYRNDHDDFGTNRTSGVTAIDDRELDQWNQIDGSVKYLYGAPAATLNWQIRGVFLDKAYDTNEIDPLNPATGTRFLEHSANGFGGRITYRLSARTQAALDVEHRDITYDTDFSPSFDGSRQSAMVGIRWESTGKTTGEFYLGSFSRDFDDSAREDLSGVTWRGRVLWALKSYSTVIFTTGQNTREQYLQGEDVITVEYLNVDWRHDWTATVHSELGVSLQDQNFEGIGRTDDVVKWHAGIDVEMAPRYLLTFGYKYINRESNFSNFEFVQNTLQLGLKATF